MTAIASTANLTAPELQATSLFDLTAVRRTASEWHSGQGSALYALSSSGAIVDGIAEEIAAAIVLAQREATREPGVLDWDDSAEYRAEIVKLEHLALYVETAGPRGRVEGWSDLHW